MMVASNVPRSAATAAAAAAVAAAVVVMDDAAAGSSSSSAARGSVAVALNLVWDRIIFQGDAVVPENLLVLRMRGATKLCPLQEKKVSSAAPEAATEVLRRRRRVERSDMLVRNSPTHSVEVQ